MVSLVMRINSTDPAGRACMSGLRARGWVPRAGTSSSVLMELGLKDTGEASGSLPCLECAKNPSISTEGMRGGSMCRQGSAVQEGFYQLHTPHQTTTPNNHTIPHHHHHTTHMYTTHCQEELRSSYGRCRPSPVSDQVLILPSLLLPQEGLLQGSLMDLSRGCRQWASFLPQSLRLYT